MTCLFREQVQVVVVVLAVRGGGAAVPAGRVCGGRRRPVAGAAPRRRRRPRPLPAALPPLRCCTAASRASELHWPAPAAAQPAGPRQRQAEQHRAVPQLCGTSESVLKSADDVSTVDPAQGSKGRVPPPARWRRGARSPLLLSGAPWAAG